VLSTLNVPVHGYLRIDPERVAVHLGTAPVRFSRFARAVRDWLAQHAGSPLKRR